MEIFKKGIKSFTFHILGSAFAVLLQFIAAKLLGSEEYGKANYLLGFAGSISVIFSFGLNFYFSKIFQEKKDTKKIFSGIFFSTAITYLIFFSIFLVLYKTSIFSYLDYIILFSISWLFILIGYLKSYLIGIHSADEASKSGNFYLKLFGLIMFPILVLLLGKNYLAFTISIIISHVIILLPFLKKNLIIAIPNFSFIKSASIFYLIQLFYSFFSEFAKILQGNFLGLKSVALLSISLIIGGLVTIFGSNFANVGLPIFANAFKEKNLKLMKDKFQEIARINAFFVVPLFFILLFNTQEVLGLFGAEYISGSIILVLILLGSFVNSFTGPNGSLLLMSGKEKLELINGIVKFIIAITISLLFGRRFIWGIALGLAVSEILVNLLKGYEVYFYYKILPLKREEGIYFILIILLEAFLFGFPKMIGLPIILYIILSPFLLVISWIITFFFSPNKSDRDILYLSLDKIKRMIT